MTLRRKHISQKLHKTDNNIDKDKSPNPNPDPNPKPIRNIYFIPIFC